MNNRKPRKSPQDFDPHLREVFLIVGFLGSGFTTCMGAYEIFNQNWLVALAIGRFFPGADVCHRALSGEVERPPAPTHVHALRGLGRARCL